MSLSRQDRNAARVFPVPVGASIRVDSPRAIAGQPSRCGAVGPGNDARNQAAVMGWKSARAVADSSSPANCDGAAMRVGCDAAAGLRLSVRFGLDEVGGIAEGAITAA